MLVQHRDLTHYLPRLHATPESLTDGPLVERRRDARVPVLMSVVVHPLDPACRERLAGAVLNVSRGGMGLHLAHAVPVGTEMQVILKDAFVLGRVRYCSAVEGGHHVGLEVQDALLRTKR